jgi:hypothetical protein
VVRIFGYDKDEGGEAVHLTGLAARLHASSSDGGLPIKQTRATASLVLHVCGVLDGLSDAAPSAADSDPKEAAVEMAVCKHTCNAELQDRVVCVVCTVDVPV